MFAVFFCAGYFGDPFRSDTLADMKSWDIIHVPLWPEFYFYFFFSILYDQVFFFSFLSGEMDEKFQGNNDKRITKSKKKFPEKKKKNGNILTLFWENVSIWPFAVPSGAKVNLRPSRWCVCVRDFFASSLLANGRLNARVESKRNWL